MINSKVVVNAEQAATPQNNFANALAFAEHGWRIFPCINDPSYPEKHKAPLTAKGFHDATTDRSTLDAWNNRFPNALWGGVMPEGICVLDSDNKPNDGKFGDITLGEMGFPFDQAGWTIQTPSGGHHFYFRGPLPCSNGRVGKGVDTRGPDGGYLILPGQTDATGKQYSVVGGTYDPTRWNPVPICIVERLNQSEPRSDCLPCPTPAPHGIDIYALPISDEIKARIRKAPSKRTDAAFDRSAAIMQVINVLRHHVTREQCLSILSDPANGISEKAREKRSPAEWLWKYGIGESYFEISPERIFGGLPVALPDGVSPVPIQSSKPQSVTTDWTDIRARPRIIARPLIESILPATSLGMLYGAPKAGKTFVTLDMCLSLAAGVNWNRKQVKHNAGPVIYVAGEGHKGLRYRVEAWELERRVQIGPGRIRLTDRAINFGDATALQALKADIDALPVKPSLIVIDTLFRATVGANVSDQEQMSKFWQTCEDMQRHYNCTILVVHHTNKSESSTSFGSIVSEASVDFQIAVEWDGESRCIRSRLTKDDSPFEDIYFDLKSTPAGFADYDDGGLTPVLSCVPEYIETPDGTTHREKAQARKIGKAMLRSPRSEIARTTLYALARIETVLGRGSAITKNQFMAAVKEYEGCITKKPPAHWVRDGISPLMRDGYVFAHEGRDDAWRLLDGAYEIAEEVNFDIFENYEPKL